MIEKTLPFIHRCFSLGTPHFNLREVWIRVGLGWSWIKTLAKLFVPNALTCRNSTIPAIKSVAILLCQLLKASFPFILGVEPVTNSNTFVINETFRKVYHVICLLFTQRLVIEEWLQEREEEISALLVNICFKLIVFIGNLGENIVKKVLNFYFVGFSLICLNILRANVKTRVIKLLG